MNTKIQTVIGAGITISLLAGCGSLKTRSLDSEVGTESKWFQNGVPYHLPATVLEVTLKSVKDAEKQTHKDLLVTVEPVFVPDASQRYILRRDNTAFFERTDKITVKNGLLNSVTTTDDSKIDDIVRSVASTALTMYSGIPVTVGSDDPESPTPAAIGAPPEAEPTQDEIEKALNMIAPGQHAYTSPLTEAIFEEVPGTGGRITLSALLVGPATGGNIVPSGSANSAPEGWKGSAVILTKTTLAKRVKVELSMDRKKLYDDRIAADNQLIKNAIKAIKILEGEIAKLEVKITQLTGVAGKEAELKVAQNEKNEKNKKKTALNNTAMVVIPPRISENTKYRKQIIHPKTNPKGTLSVLVPIAERSAVIPVTDDSSIFAISVKPAAFGLTKHTLTLDHGVLTDTDVERPSSALKIVKVPADIAKAVVDIPGQLFERDSKNATTVEDLETKRLTNESTRLSNEGTRLSNEKTMIELKKAQASSAGSN